MLEKCFGSLRCEKNLKILVDLQKVGTSSSRNRVVTSGTGQSQSPDLRVKTDTRVSVLRLGVLCTIYTVLLFNI